MKYNTKFPTTGNRTACKKATPPPLTQEILFARKLKKVAAEADDERARNQLASTNVSKGGAE